MKHHITSLQEKLADPLNVHEKKHVTHNHCISEKKKQLNRFNEDQDPTPKSTRTDFQFHMSQEAEHSEEFSDLKEETDRIITDFQIALNEQVKKAIKLEIAIQEQELQDNYIESIRLITRVFVINANRTPNTDTVVAALMDVYLGRLLKHTHMNQSEFN